MAAGILDPSFGNGGIVVHDLNGVSWNSDIPAQTAVLSDGKILVAGTRDAYSNSQDFAVARYLPNGVLDGSFGIGGVAIVDFGPRDSLYAMVVTPSGQIVLGGGIGYYPGQGALARLNANGSADTSFGTAGKVVFDVGGDGENISSLALQSNGKIIAGGAFNTWRPIVTRFNTDGSLDTAFGVNGIAQPLNGTLAVSLGVKLAIQPDDRIVMGGMDTGRYRMFVSRFDANGAVDTSFDGDGFAEAKFTNTQSFGVKDVALQPDGKILLAGNRFNVPNNATADIAIVRFNTNGSLDTDFAANGFFVSNRSGDDEAIAVTVQSDGRIIIVGRQNQDSLIARLTSLGTFDITFGTNGVTVSPMLNDGDQFNDVVLQADGAIVAMSDAARKFGLARFLNAPAYAIPFIGGPYNVGEGGSLALSGMGANENEPTGTLNFFWDLDNDGVFGEIGADARQGDEAGRTPTFQAGSLDGLSSWPIKVRVTDGNGFDVVAQGAIEIGNIPPTASFTNSGPADEGTAISVAFSNFFDHSTTDTSSGFRFAFDFDNDGIWDRGSGSYMTGDLTGSAFVPAQYLDDIAPSRVVKGRIIDKNNGFRDYTTTIAIRPVNDAPTEIGLDGTRTVFEKSPPDIVVGLLATIDADLDVEGDNHVYTLVDSAAGRFKIVGNELRVANGNMMDSQINPSHAVRIRSSDSHGVWIERDFVINISAWTMSHTTDNLEVALNDTNTYQLRQAGNQAWFLDVDHELNSNGDYSTNYGGANEKWLRGKANEFDNPWYFIKPNGELFAWNGDAGFPSGTWLATLEPVYWAFPQLLHIASAEILPYALDRALNLRTDNGNLWENYSGHSERWLVGNGSWFYITPTGAFYGGGRLLTTLDPVYYHEISRLYNALPSQIAATLTPAHNGNGPKLVIDPVAGFLGNWVVEVASTNGAFTAANRFTVSVTNSVPTLPRFLLGSMPTSQDTLTISTDASDPDTGDSLHLQLKAGNIGYVYDTIYQLEYAGTAYDNSSGGFHERWFTGIPNVHGNRWYYIATSGTLVAWAGRAGIDGTFVEYLPSVYWRYPNLLAQAQPNDLAYEIDRWVDLYIDPSGTWENYGGIGNRWLRGAGGEWYSIDIRGNLYQQGGGPLATLGSTFYNDLERLTNPRQNQAVVSVSGSNVIVNPAPNFVGDLWILVEASDLPFSNTNRRKSQQFIRIMVSA